MNMKTEIEMEELIKQVAELKTKLDDNVYLFGVLLNKINEIKSEIVEVDKSTEDEIKSHEEMLKERLDFKTFEDIIVFLNTEVGLVKYKLFLMKDTNSNIFIINTLTFKICGINKMGLMYMIDNDKFNFRNLRFDVEYFGGFGDLFGVDKLFSVYQLKTESYDFKILALEINSSYAELIKVL